MKKLEDYEDKIDEWHDGDSKLKLHEYLGLTWEEYSGMIRPSELLTSKLYADKVISFDDRYPDKGCRQVTLPEHPIMSRLKESRIVSFKPQEDGTIRVQEKCDRYFTEYLTRDDILKLAEELIDLVDRRKK
jgi:hypothetical protein